MPNFNQNKNFKKKDNNFIKPVKTDIQFVVSGTTNKGPYDKNSCYCIMEELNNSNAFSMLQVPVTCSRATIEKNPEARGSKVVGRVLGYDITNSTITVSIFGEFIHLLDAENLTIIPKIRTAYNSDTVSTITGFVLEV